MKRTKTHVTLLAIGSILGMLLAVLLFATPGASQQEEASLEDVLKAVQSVEERLGILQEKGPRSIPSFSEIDQTLSRIDRRLSSIESTLNSVQRDLTQLRRR